MHLVDAETRIYNAMGALRDALRALDLPGEMDPAARLLRLFFHAQHIP